MNKQQIKAILEGAPEGATHISSNGVFYKVEGYTPMTWWVRGKEWIDTGVHHITSSLSDLRAQLALIEENERLVGRVSQLEKEDGYCNDEMSWECSYDAIEYHIDENTKVGDVFTFNAYSWVKDKTFVITNINDNKGTFDFKELNND